MKTTPLGQRRHFVTLANPGPAVSDGDGGYLQVWTDLDPPSLYVSILPATAKDLERVASGTVLSTASHIVTGPYHAQVTTKTRLTFGPRTLNVVGVANPEERNVELVLLCAEVVA
jgi:head-tail adaptor